MARKNALKEQNKDLEFNLVDFLCCIDPSKTNKYTTFLIKEFKKALIEREENSLQEKSSEDIHEIYRNIINKTEFEKTIFRFIFDTINRENIETLWSYHNHVENNRIKGCDIQQFKDFNEIKSITAIADIDEQEKNLKSDILELFRDDEWVVIKPLTLIASLVYGSRTKWCTSMKNDTHYFYDYSARGSLIYIINRKTNYKVAMFIDHSRNHGGLKHTVSFWDVLDNKIDSMEVELPNNIMKILKNELAGPMIANNQLFSLQEYNRGYGDNKGLKKMRMEEQQPILLDGVMEEVEVPQVTREHQGHVRENVFVVGQNDVDARA